MASEMFKQVLSRIEEKQRLDKKIDQPFVLTRGDQDVYGY